MKQSNALESGGDFLAGLMFVNDFFAVILLLANGCLLIIGGDCGILRGHSLCKGATLPPIAKGPYRVPQLLGLPFGCR